MTVFVLASSMPAATATLSSIKSTVPAFTVAGSTASLKVTVIVEFVATFEDPAAGLKDVTVGAVVSVGATVENETLTQ